MKSAVTFALLASVAYVGLSAGAQAQNYDQAYEYQDKLGQYRGADSLTGNGTNDMPRDLQLTVAVGVGAAPEYFGSDDYEAVFVPSLDLEYHNAFLVINREAMMNNNDGLGYKVLANENFDMGVSVLLDRGRSDDNRHIRGMGDVNPAALAGGFVSGQYGPAFARAQLHMDVLGEYDGGYRGELGTGVKGQLRPDLKGMLETTARYGSENYNEEYFSVSGRQSAATGLRRYNADSGFYQWGLGGTLQYNITPGLFVQGQAKYDKVLGEAADSPVTQSDNQYYVGTNVGYTF